MANSQWANKLANGEGKFSKTWVGQKVGKRVGRAAQDSGEYLGKSTFDVRNTKLGEKGASKLGLDVGKASKGSEGGFEGAKKRKDEKRMERQKHLEDRQTKGKKNEIAEEESKLNNLHNEAEELRNAIAPEMNKLDKELQGLSKAFTDASEKAKLSGLQVDKDDALKAQAAVKNKEKEMLALKKGEEYEGDRNEKGVLDTSTSHKRYEGDGYKTASGHTLHQMEKEVIPEKEIAIKGKHIEVSAIKKKIRNDHADRIDNGWNKTLNFVTSMGMHSGKGADSTAKKLRRVERESYSSAIPQPK